MMDSSAWTVPDHPMHSTTEDEFQQFLDMNTMGNMGDGINYDFHDFHQSTNPHLMQSPPREHLDTPMSGTESTMILSRVDPALQQHMPAITTSSPYQSIPATMMGVG